MKKLTFIIAVALIVGAFGGNVKAQDNRIWATYYGGGGDEINPSVAIDKWGNVYMAGITSSISGIASGGYQNNYGGGGSDAFLVKFNATGNRLWATYYGGSDYDYGYSVATDKWGNIYLSGFTYSPSGIASGGFQNTIGSNGYSDAFLVKFDTAGNRIWATYYGGSSYEEGRKVTTDSTGNVYMAGYTQSNSGIASGGFQNAIGGSWDAFLIKFDNSGNRLWATYYGGSSTDKGFSIATDSSDNVYLSGFTGSTSGIASGGFQNTFGGGGHDAFLAKFDSTGNRLWATYYGGTGDESNAFQSTTSIATDASDNILLASFTNSTTNIASGGFQNTNNGNGDAFLVKFDSNGNRLWATYYGGTYNDCNHACSVAIDGAGNIYLAGDTYSASNIANGGFQNSLIGTENQFIVKFDAMGSMLCATYYGNGHEEDGAVAADRLGAIYLTGQTPAMAGIASGGFQNTYGGGQGDAYLVKFSSCFSTLSVTALSTANTCADQCIGSAVVTSAGGTPPYSYSWNSTPVQTNDTATGLCKGIYTVVVSDGAGNTSTASVTITNPPAISNTVTSTAASCATCCDACISTNVAGGCAPLYTYNWSPNNPTPCSACAGVAYTVTVSDSCGCTRQTTITPDTVAVTVGIAALATPPLTYQLFERTLIFSEPVNEIKVFDIPGRLQFSLSNSAFSKTTLPQLSSGLYIMQASTKEGKIVSGKIFVE